MSTIDYYDQNAQEYYERTVDADLAEIREYFLGFLRRDARILDFGCGSGRNALQEKRDFSHEMFRYAKAFAEAGRTVEALDGSQELCRIASEYLGMDVRNTMFQDFEETEAYDGLWACASILHLTYEEIMDVMKRIHGALKPQGVFYTTFKYGTFEGERDGRYYTDFEEKKMERLLAELNCFDLERMWLTGDALPGRHEGQWINVILRRKR